MSGIDWNGWEDVSVHGYPDEGSQVIFCLNGESVFGAFIGGIFWYNNQKHAAFLWMPKPEPLPHDDVIYLIKKNISESEDK